MAKGKWAFISLLFALVACQSAFSVPATATQAPTPQPTPTLQMSASPVAAASPTPSPDSGWQALQPGLERRTIRLLAENGRQTEHLYLFRLDPTLFEFKIAYSPGQPKSLATWQAETKALIVINGGFFTEEYLATGLVILDRQPNGSSYVGFGGMVTIGQGGVAVRSLRERPYDPQEQFDFALQAFPMLLLNGEPAYQKDDPDVARRTVIGVDEDGRVLLILATWGTLTLAELSSTLAEADFGLVNALNLDGGTSTGLVLADPAESVPSFAVVPSVITIYQR